MAINFNLLVGNETKTQFDVS